MNLSLESQKIHCHPSEQLKFSWHFLSISFLLVFRVLQGPQAWGVPNGDPSGPGLAARAHHTAGAGPPQQTQTQAPPWGWRWAEDISAFKRPWLGGAHGQAVGQGIMATELKWGPRPWRPGKIDTMPHNTGPWHCRLKQMSNLNFFPTQKKTLCKHDEETIYRAAAVQLQIIPVRKQLNTFPRKCCRALMWRQDLGHVVEWYYIFPCCRRACQGESNTMNHEWVSRKRIGLASKGHSYCHSVTVFKIHGACLYVTGNYRKV